MDFSLLFHEEVCMNEEEFCAIYVSVRWHR